MFILENISFKNNEIQKPFLMIYTIHITITLAAFFLIQNKNRSCVLLLKSTIMSHILFSVLGCFRKMWKIHVEHGVSRSPCILACLYRLLYLFIVAMTIDHYEFHAERNEYSMVLV